MNSKKVSIIIPLYNGKEFLTQTVTSCLQQSHYNLEIIVVDDKSSDESVEIIRELQKKDGRIKLLCNETNLGIIKNANKGIESSRGDYILVLGQDDIISTKHIETMLSCFDENVSMVFCGSILIDSKNKEIGIHPLNECRENITLYNLSLGNCVNSCGLIMNREILKKVGLYREDNRWENYGEWNLWIRMCVLGRIRFCSEVKSFYRRHETNISKTFWTYKGYSLLRSFRMDCMKLAYSLSNLNIRQRIHYYNNYYKYCIKSFIRMKWLYIVKKLFRPI